MFFFFSPTCLLGAEVLERIAGRVRVEQQDGEGQIGGVSWNDGALLEIGLERKQRREKQKGSTCSATSAR